MHPVLFHIPTPWGAIPLYSYGVMLGTSLIIGWYFVMWAGVRKEGIDREVLANTFIYTAITAIVGSRILYIITNPGEFDSPGDWFRFRQGGLVAYGGFLGGFIGAYYYLHRKKIPFLAFADIAVPTLGTGLLFTRIGCWLYGCDFGRPLAEDAPDFLQSLGTFPHWDFSTSPELACDNSMTGSPAWNHHRLEYDLPADAPTSLPAHPTQIYESIAGALLFAATFTVLQKRRFRGQVLTIGAALYALWRFGIEFVRDDPERGSAFGLSTSQLISLLILPACAFSYWWIRRRYLEEGDAPIPAHARVGAKAEAEAKLAQTEAEKPSASVRKRKKRKKR